MENGDQRLPYGSHGNKGWEIIRHVLKHQRLTYCETGIMEADMEDSNTQIGRLDYEKKIKEGSLHEMRGKEVEAKMNYEKLRGDQQSLLKSIRVPRKEEALCI